MRFKLYSTGNYVIISDAEPDAEYYPSAKKAVRVVDCPAECVWDIVHMLTEWAKGEVNENA